MGDDAGQRVIPGIHVRSGVGRPDRRFRQRWPERKSDPDYTGELYAIYVLDKFQRQGAGTLLLRAVVARLVEIGIESMKVWVLTDNPAQAFYERLGGVVVGQTTIKIAGIDLGEVAYGWKHLVV